MELTFSKQIKRENRWKIMYIHARENITWSLKLVHTQIWAWALTKNQRDNHAPLNFVVSIYKILAINMVQTSLHVSIRSDVPGLTYYGGAIYIYRCGLKQLNILYSYSLEMFCNYNQISKLNFSFLTWK